MSKQSRPSEEGYYRFKVCFICLYEVLLYADGEDAILYAQAAQLGAELLDDSVARLDSTDQADDRSRDARAERGCEHAS